MDPVTTRLTQIVPLLSPRFLWWGFCLVMKVFVPSSQSTESSQADKDFLKILIDIFLKHLNEQKCHQPH